ncbi:MAG TPA: biosynthetic peptidoglycan transglycosylase [Gemmatimonadota bacterium]
MLSGAARAAGWLAAAAVIYVLSAAVRLPEIATLRWLDPPSTALSRLRVERGGPAPERGAWTPLRDISPSLVEAVLHAEDDRFPHHGGFDAPRIRLALSRNVEERRVATGASTITQQLAKNLFLDPARQPLRKAKEALLALALEGLLPKPRILEIYLNVIEWGRGLYGVDAAARRYFAVAPARIGPERAALLAASIPAPLLRNPGHVTPGLRRSQARILGLMSRRRIAPPEWTR